MKYKKICRYCDILNQFYPWEYVRFKQFNFGILLSCQYARGKSVDVQLNDENIGNWFASEIEQCLLKLSSFSQKCYSTRIFVEYYEGKLVYSISYVDKNDFGEEEVIDQSVDLEYLKKVLLGYALLEKE